jgi:uncharacterized protein YfbU (UPF0304 family)
MFTHGERIIAAMLADIGQHLKVKGNVDFAEIESAIGHYQEWSIAQTHSHIVPDGFEMPPHVRETHDILNMWRVLDDAIAALTPADRTKLGSLPGVPAQPGFSGFDANNEDHYHAAKYMIDNMGLYPERKGKPLNSHSPTIGMYRRMYAAYRKVMDRKAFGAGWTAADVEEVLRAVPHP